MKKTTFSWRGIIFSIAAVLLVFLGFFVLLVGNTFQKQLQRTYETENRRAVQTWEAMMSERLDIYSGYIEELTRTIYNGGAELRVGSAPMDFRLRKKCADAMSDKLKTTIGLDAMFILSEDIDAPIVITKSSGESADWNARILSVKSYLNAGIFPVQSIWEGNWQLIQIDNTAYVFRAVRLGKYYVGALGPLTNFDFTSKMHILGDHYTCTLISGGDIYRIAGENWQDDLRLDETGQPQSASSGVSFLSTELSKLDSQLLLAVRDGNSASIFGTTLHLLLITGASCILLAVALILILYRMVSLPVKKMLTATDRIKAGDLTFQMQEHWGNREFNTLSGSFNAMVRSIHQARIDAYDRELQKRQDELTMLRAQIQPHFYLNAITTISNMTYQNRNEEIRQYIAALAKFMRYMLNLQCKQVLLSDELAHIGNYLKMQAIRFPNSVEVDTYLDPRAENLEIPYLLLFTVVENTFKHAMDLYRTLQLHIRCDALEDPTFAFCISVRDNGSGFTPEVLERIRSNAAPANAKEHLGLTNVRRTLMLTYGRDNLLRLSNPPEGGALVEILIPRENNEKGAANHEAANV